MLFLIFFLSRFEALYEYSYFNSDINYEKNINNPSVILDSADSISQSTEEEQFHEDCETEQQMSTSSNIDSEHAKQDADNWKKDMLDDYFDCFSEKFRDKSKLGTATKFPLNNSRNWNKRFYNEIKEGIRILFIVT